MPDSRIVVNNAGLDPLQGFHTTVYVNDQRTGMPVLAGGFTSFQKTMRNATEPYMPFGRKTPRLLDGEFQYGWVLERGMLDIRVMEEVFGFDHMGAEFKADPTPRFIITVEFNAPELHETGAFYGSNAPKFGMNTGLLTGTPKRSAQGKYQLLFAKVDSVTTGAMSGRNVVATRIEGLCEAIKFVPTGLVENSGHNNTAESPNYSPTLNTTKVTIGGKERNYLFG